MKTSIYFIAIFFLLVSETKAGMWQSRIAGGSEASLNEFPYIVALKIPLLGRYCAGSLIAKNWILTAAHCVWSSDLEIITGLNSSAGEESFKAAKILIHPNYARNNGDYSYDFALIQLNGNSRSPLIRYATSAVESQSILADIAGWGATSDGEIFGTSVLMRATVPLVNNERCHEVYGQRVDGSMICAGFEAGGVDSCDGDSGGPLVAKNEAGESVLAGITSWGDGCARPHLFGVYAKVSVVSNWIEKSIANF